MSRKVGERERNQKGIGDECGRKEQEVAWFAEEDDGEARHTMDEQSLFVFPPLKGNDMGEGATLQKSYHFYISCYSPTPPRLAVITKVDVGLIGHHDEPPCAQPSPAKCPCTIWGLNQHAP